MGQPTRDSFKCRPVTGASSAKQVPLPQCRIVIFLSLLALSIVGWLTCDVVGDEGRPGWPLHRAAHPPVGLVGPVCGVSIYMLFFFFFFFSFSFLFFLFFSILQMLNLFIFVQFF
jgi:hypothetical protein